MENIIPFLIVGAVVWVAYRKSKKLPVIPAALSQRFSKRSGKNP